MDADFSANLRLDGEVEIPVEPTPGECSVKVVTFDGEELLKLQWRGRPHRGDLIQSGGPVYEIFQIRYNVTTKEYVAVVASI